MSEALFAALSHQPPSEAAAFEAMKAGARLRPEQLAQLPVEAIALYAKLLGLLELVETAALVVEAGKKSAEHREAAAAAAKRILAGAAKAYGELAEVAVLRPPLELEQDVEPEETRDRGFSM